MQISTIGGCNSFIWLDKGRVRKLRYVKGLLLEYIATLGNNSEVAFGERLYERESSNSSFRI